MALVSFALLAAIGAPARAERDNGPGPLPWRVGGALGFTADAASFPDSAGPVLDLYVRIPPATIRDLVADTSGAVRLRLTARLKSRFGALQHEALQEFTLVPADTVGGFGKVVLLRFPARPGGARLQIRLEDLQSRKRGIVYLGRSVVHSSAVEGEVEIPLAPNGRGLSDIEFVWSERPGWGGAFQHAGEAVLPNPERLYGLYQSELMARIAARSRPGDTRPWHWRARLMELRNDTSRTVAERESVATGSATFETRVAMDLSHLKAGGYDLEVHVWQEGDSLPFARRGHLSVAWDPETWTLNPRDLADLVHFLLDPDQEEAFQGLGPGEQERYLEDFWRRRDPTPETAVNEALVTFRARVDYANHTYSRMGLGKGMFSDMGRVYIRYGAPSEIHHQVIPTGSETLEEVVNQLAARETRALGDVTDKELGGDLRPFELWIYDAGTGLPPDADPTVAQKTRQRRMVFLFVDEHGLGDFRLVYSTE